MNEDVIPCEDQNAAEEDSQNDDSKALENVVLKKKVELVKIEDQKFSHFESIHQIK